MYVSNSSTSYIAPSALRSSAVAVLACAYLVGTGGSTGVAYLTSRQDQGYRFIHVENFSTVSSSAAQLNVRSTIETLDRIREIFKFSISDLASACMVSRQAVYKWLSGNSSLEWENQNRLEDLYRAAELFATRGVAGTASLLKRTNNTGRTLVETMRAGDSAQEWARTILDTLELESRQRAMLDARLRARKRPAPAVEEWGTPMLSEKIPNG
jgi:transcriptional regulator with XRE-family HTH domain